MDKIVKLDRVDHYNRLYGLETLHPLVSIVDLAKATRTVNHIQMTYGIYALFLKRMRFYERQFITRDDANKDALARFEQLLDDYSS